MNLDSIPVVPPRVPMPLPRRNWHRAIFTLAGIYNIAWGLYAALDPGWLFRYAEMPPQNYPEIFACLGMVVGLYGVLYLEVARVPERGWLIAAVGLAGKVLGPIGLVKLIWSGTWPPATLVLCVTNDFVWWLPFALYLYDASPWGAWPWDPWSWRSSASAPSPSPPPPSPSTSP